MLLQEGRKDKEPKIDEKYNHLILLAKNNEGYKNLAKLSVLGFIEGFYYKPRMMIKKFWKNIMKE